MARLTISLTCATWSMPMKASTSGMSLGSSSRKRCERQPETMTAWPRRLASRSSTDSRMVSTLSSCAESMKEQVLTMTASACAASLVISTPPFISEPSMISASTRFLAQPSEIKPTRSGRGSVFFSLVTESKPTRTGGGGRNYLAAELVGRLSTALVRTAGALVLGVSAGNPSWVRSTARAAKGRPRCWSSISVTTWRFMVS